MTLSHTRLRGIDEFLKHVSMLTVQAVGLRDGVGMDVPVNPRQRATAVMQSRELLAPLQG